MNKIIIALGLTLAAAIAHSAQAGVDYTATASVGDTVKAERFERSLEQFNR